MVRQLGRWRAADHAAVRERCIVVDDEGIVCGPPHVELDTVRAELDGSPEGGNRVLGLGARGASMGDDYGHGTIVADRLLDIMRPTSRYLIFRWPPTFYLIFLPTVRT